MAPFLRDHWHETEPHPEAAPYDPDFDLYFNLERDGRLAIFTARRGDVILGFNLFVIATTFARRAVLTASSNILFLRPAERGGATARKLILWPENDLRARGAKFVRYSPATMYDLGILLARCGYARKSGDYEKVLE